MVKLKSFMIICFLFSSLIVPSTASASTNSTYYYSDSTFQKFLTIIRSFLNDKEYQDYTKIIAKYKDWKENYPQEESIDIWRRWYCD